MTSKKLSFLLLLCITSRVLSLSCPGPCVRSDCDPKFSQGCTAGLTRDACGCCDKCAKDVGEVCGGPWDIAGVCGDGLTCNKDTNPNIAGPPRSDFNARGKCIKDASNCDENGEPKFCALDLVPKCGSNGVRYGSSCEFASAQCKNPELGEIPCDVPQPDCERLCPAIFAPVCGSDGVTYSNQCALSIASCKNPDIKFDYEGDCAGNDREFTLGFERFILLDDHKGVTWQQARNLCQRSGYDLAQPQIDITQLASYLLTNYGLTYYWVGGKGQGSNIAWLSGQVVSSGSPLWREAQQGFQSSTNFCMYLRDDGNPNPLGNYNCQDTTYLTPLCEANELPPAAPAAPPADVPIEIRFN